MIKALSFAKMSSIRKVCVAAVAATVFSSTVNGLSLKHKVVRCIKDASRALANAEQADLVDRDIKIFQFDGVSDLKKYHKWSTNKSWKSGYVMHLDKDQNIFVLRDNNREVWNRQEINAFTAQGTTDNTVVELCIKGTDASQVKWTKSSKKQNLCRRIKFGDDADASKFIQVFNRAEIVNPAPVDQHSDQAESEETSAFDRSQDDGESHESTDDGELQVHAAKSSAATAASVAATAASAAATAASSMYPNVYRAFGFEDSAAETDLGEIPISAAETAVGAKAAADSPVIDESTAELVRLGEEQTAHSLNSAHEIQMRNQQMKNAKRLLDAKNKAGAQKFAALEQEQKRLFDQEQRKVHQEVRIQEEEANLWSLRGDVESQSRAHEKANHENMEAMIDQLAAARDDRAAKMQESLKKYFGEQNDLFAEQTAQRARTDTSQLMRQKAALRQLAQMNPLALDRM